MLLLVGGAVSVTVQLELGLDGTAGRTAGTRLYGMADRDARYGPVNAAGRGEVAERFAVTQRGRCAQ